MSKRPDSVAPWLWSVRPGGKGTGFLHKFDTHAVGYVEQDRRQLVVTFDNLAEMGDTSLMRGPWSYDFFAERGCSVMGVMARRGIWFRDPALISYLASLSKGGFFKQFERVLFTGNSMGGFGALAFSRLAPGADVLAFSPQTSLDKALVPWETRFEKSWSADWTLPHSDAAEGLESAGAVTVIYDPVFELDKRHVDRITAPNVTKLTAWYASHKSPVFLRRLDMLREVSEAALERALTPELFYASYRRRKDTPWYRNALKDHADRTGHGALATRLDAILSDLKKADNAQQEAHWFDAGKALRETSRGARTAFVPATRASDCAVFALSYAGDPYLETWLSYTAQFVDPAQITLLYAGARPQAAGIGAVDMGDSADWAFISDLADRATRSGKIACVLPTTCFLVADPEAANNPFDHFARTDARPFAHAFGIECVHHRMLSPVPLDLSAPLLAQRPYYRQNSAATRPVFARAPQRWSRDGAQVEAEELHVSEDIWAFDVTLLDHDLGCHIAARHPASRYKSASAASIELDGILSQSPSERTPLAYRAHARLFAHHLEARAQAKADAPFPAPKSFVLRKRLFCLPHALQSLF